MILPTRNSLHGCFIGILACCQALAQDIKVDEWKEQAIANVGLVPAQVIELEASKFLVGDKEFAQIFSAYIGAKQPVFITSDAVLNGYHVLFEEAMRVVEQDQAEQMMQNLKLWWNVILRLKCSELYLKDVDQAQLALERILLVVGVAHRLCGGELQSAPLEIREPIEAEVSAILRSKGFSKPSFLGGADDDFVAFDYSLFEPIGFYTESEKLKRYYRATRWLQLVPFRGNKKIEVLAFHLLNVSLDSKISKDSSSQSVRYWLSSRQEVFSAIGKSENPGLLDPGQKIIVGSAPWNNDSNFFELIVKNARSKPLPNHSANDRVQIVASSAADADFRILPSIVTPEDRLFAYLRPRSQTKPPGGEEFCAMLGMGKLADSLVAESIADFAGREFAAYWKGDASYTDDEPWWKEVEGAPMVVILRSALHALGELDKDAPQFMRSKKWHKKTLNTVVASWAQERHAWGLQAKPSLVTVSGFRKIAGYVEPVPEFYVRLGWLAEKAAQFVRSAESNLNPATGAVEEAQRISTLLRTYLEPSVDNAGIEDAISDARKLLLEYERELDDLNLDEIKKIDVEATLRRLESFVSDLEIDAKPGQHLWRLTQKNRHQIEPLLRKLQMMCLRLTTLAVKQLNEREFTAEDMKSIKLFGLHLSEIMLYQHSSSANPRDDAPRVARIYSDPAINKIHYIGTGKPREIYVLYPWRGEEVLCQGAIIPYYELSSPAIFTDKMWRELLELREETPFSPSWLDGLMSTRKK